MTFEDENIYLIGLVEDKPFLWNPNEKQYNKQLPKTKEFNVICRAMIKKFDKSFNGKTSVLFSISK